MGLIVTIFMMGLTSPSGENFILAAIIGNIGAIIGSIVSVRLMLLHTKKKYMERNLKPKNHMETNMI